MIEFVGFLLVLLAVIALLRDDAEGKDGGREKRPSLPPIQEWYSDRDAQRGPGSTWPPSDDFYDLSEYMRAALRSATKHGRLDPSSIPGKGRTFNALERRGIARPDGSLTEAGFCLGISLLPLNRQIPLLGLTAERFEYNPGDRPEPAVLRAKRAKGLSGMWDEGGAIHLLFDSVCFKRIQTLAQYWNSDPIYGTASRFSGSVRFSHLLSHHYRLYRPDVEAKIMADIESSSRDEVLENADELARLRNLPKEMGGKRDWNRYRDLLGCVYTALGARGLRGLAEKAFADSFRFAGGGWPDLTLCGATGIQLIEVKTTDRLSYTQVLTLELLRETPVIEPRIAIAERSPDG